MLLYASTHCVRICRGRRSRFDTAPPPRPACDQPSGTVLRAAAESALEYGATSSLSLSLSLSLQSGLSCPSLASGQVSSLRSSCLDSFILRLSVYSLDSDHGIPNHQRLASATPAAVSRRGLRGLSRIPCVLYLSAHD